jgi:hypothetical protein
MHMTNATSETPKKHHGIPLSFLGRSMGPTGTMSPPNRQPPTSFCRCEVNQFSLFSIQVKPNAGERPRFTQYNGGGERAQDEMQKALATANIPQCDPVHVAAHIGQVTHDLNHNPRASLKGKCSCELFHTGLQYDIVTRRQRKESAEKPVRLTAIVLAEIEAPTKRQEQKAWRLVVEEWLIQNGHVTEKTKDVLPRSRVQKNS